MYDDGFNDRENDEKEDGVPCEKGRTSKLFIMYKLVMMFDYNVEQNIIGLMISEDNCSVR